MHLMKSYLINPGVLSGAHIKPEPLIGSRQAGIRGPANWVSRLAGGDGETEKTPSLRQTYRSPFLFVIICFCKAGEQPRNLHQSFSEGVQNRPKHVWYKLITARFQ